MPTVIRVKMRWDGFTGGPGFSVFHFRNLSEAGLTQTDADAAVAKVSAFANAIKHLIPYQSRLSVEPDVEAFDSASGQLQTVMTSGNGTPIISTATTAQTYNGAAGASITWRTSEVRNGRRIRGRTFLVPLISASFTNGGQLSTSLQTELNAAATTLRDQSGVPDLVVWARPSGPGATDGDLAAISGHSIPSRGSVLRSRRD